ncbi:hypothetical protein F4775DRAFT_550224 [Biscogniauxia sp. FL1348]|nr:hypothetical protein F4775DRAFT_550224 [Biscogniauxia sp. FL1348]
MTITSGANEPTATWTIITTFSQLPTFNMTKEMPASTSGRNISSSSIVASQPTETVVPPVQHRSKAWIAGPVAGGAAVAMLVLLAVGFLWRRKRARARASATQELHGETAKKAELHADTVPQELDGTEASNIAELPVDETTISAYTGTGKSTSQGAGTLRREVPEKRDDKEAEQSPDTRDQKEKQGP